MTRPTARLKAFGDGIVAIAITQDLSAQVPSRIRCSTQGIFVPGLGGPACQTGAQS